MYIYHSDKQPELFDYQDKTRRKLRVVLHCYIVLLIYIEYVYVYMRYIFASFIMMFPPDL